MTDRTNNALGRWLLAERSGESARADHALRELFSVLHDPVPPPGFVGRVMAGLVPLPVGEQLALAWRLTLAACLMLAALSVAYLPLVLIPLIETVRLGSVVGLVGTALVAGSQALADWLAFWQTLADVNRVLVTVVSKPPIALILAAVAGLTAVTFRVLSGLMVAERSTDHA